MNKSRLLSLLAVTFALAATVLSFKLLVKHVTGSSGSAWFEAGCGESDEGGTTDCAAVLASPHSYWPPKKPGEPPGTRHVPVAFVGLLYYSVLAVWLIGIGRPSPTKLWIHVFPTLFVAAGLAASAYFTYIMFSKLDEWCPWCLVTHVFNVGLASCVVLMWRPAPGAPGGTEAPEPEAGPARDRPGSGHPSRRLVLMTLITILGIVFAEDQMLGRVRSVRAALSNKQGLDQCVAAIKRIKRNPDTLVQIWKSAPVQPVRVDVSDPFRLGRENAVNPLELVVFSDFECPSCKRLMTLLDEKVQPLFDGRLKVIFKHYPLNRDCNPMTTTAIHRHACTAAAVAEGARNLGGNRAFWNAHDYLFAHQDDLKRGRLTSDDVAAQIGLPPQDLRDAAASKESVERIREDARQARAYGVSSTPTVFLAGRRVDPILRNEIRFWDRVASAYWRSRGEPRPESTKLSAQKATPNNPNPKAAP